MSNQLFGYTSTNYGGGGAAAGSLFNSRSAADTYIPADTSLLAASSRYLTADLLSSSSTLSSSLLYHPENYSARIPGMSSTTPTRYGPPGVDDAATLVPTDPLYAGLKRNSSECKNLFPFLLLFLTMFLSLCGCNGLVFANCCVKDFGSSYLRL